MYITIDDIIGEQTINLSYPIRSNKEITVVSLFSDNVQYNVLKPHTIIDSISPDKRELIQSKTYYAGRESLHAGRNGCIYPICK